MKKLKLCLVMCLTIVLQFNTLIIHSYADVNIESHAAICYDITNKQILYEKNINEKMYPASITKLVTGHLATKYGDLNDDIEFSAKSLDLEPNSSNLAFTKGEVINVKESLYGLMLKSANEVANQLAEYAEDKTGKTYNQLTNELFAEIGCTNTNFTSPSGLHEDTHYTCAYDMALIASHIYNDTIFRDIFSTSSHTILSTSYRKNLELYNTHKIFSRNSPFHVEGFVGGKTGYTDEAGNTLVSFFEKDDRLVVTVILKAENSTMAYNDTVRLYNDAFDNYSKETVLKAGDILKSIPVFDDNGSLAGNVNITSRNDINLLLKNETDESDEDIEDSNTDDEDEDNNKVKKSKFNLLKNTNESINVEINLPESITTSVKPQDLMGDIIITQNDGKLSKTYSMIALNGIHVTEHIVIDYNFIYIICFSLIFILLVTLIYHFIKLSSDERKL